MCQVSHSRSPGEHCRLESSEAVGASLECFLAVHLTKAAAWLLHLQNLLVDLGGRPLPAPLAALVALVAVDPRRWDSGGVPIAGSLHVVGRLRPRRVRWLQAAADCHTSRSRLALASRMPEAQALAC